MEKFDIPNPIRKPDIRDIISLIGRAMITLGLILLLFVAYQLWGTNYFEHQSQKKLSKEFEQQLRARDRANKSTTTTSPSSSTTKPGDNPVVSQPTQEELNQLSQEVEDGKPIAIIEIPAIGLKHVVVSGTSKSDLQKGPGHYPATPLPGQQGNSAIAGHRTTYGAPFNRLDELKVGDKIILDTLRGPFTYIVDKPNKVVSPSDVSVINPTQDPNDPKKLLPTLTLTTCHPKYSAAKRLVISASLDPSQVEGAQQAAQLVDKSTGKLPTKIDIGNQDDTQNTSGIGHSNILAAMAIASFHVPLLFWLLLLATVGCIWWYFFKKYHNWQVWVIGFLPFAVVLLFYFIHLEQALPSNI